MIFGADLSRACKTYSRVYAYVVQKTDFLLHPHTRISHIFVHEYIVIMTLQIISALYTVHCTIRGPVRVPISSRPWHFKANFTVEGYIYLMIYIIGMKQIMHMITFAFFFNG